MWKDSKAKRILHKDIMKGLVLKEAKDTQNRSTMKLQDVCNVHPEECHQHDCKKFSGRLSNLRAKFENA